MKRLLSILAAAGLLLALAACGNSNQPEPGGLPQSAAQEPEDTPAVQPAEPEAGAGGGVLVAYYSATGRTEAVAGYIAGATGGGTFWEDQFVTPGTTERRGFLQDNVLHAGAQGGIHYSSYIPGSYDGSEPYALFVTLPGWEGLYFQGIGANMAEDFGPDAGLLGCRGI